MASTDLTDLPQEIPAPTTRWGFVVSLLGPLVLLVATHFTYTWYAKAAQPEPEQGGFDGGFFAHVDYRSIEMFTVKPGYKAGYYRFDEFGFRLDRHNLRFGQPTGYKTIWVFGNSALQGHDLKEDETIPAHLNALLQESGMIWRAFNLGQGGYGSTQDLLLLIELLQQGHRPDALVIYDGINEQPGAGGWETEGERAFFAGCIQTKRPSGGLLSFGLKNFLKRGDAWWDLKYDLSEQLPMERRRYGGDWRMATQRYLANVQMIKSIADGLNVPAFLFFQPLMQYEDHYQLRRFSDHEAEHLARLMWVNEHERREALYQEEFALQRQALGRSFVDLYDVFKGMDGVTLYQDPRHTNGKGNAVIAQRILEVMRPALKARAHRPPAAISAGGQSYP